MAAAGNRDQAAAPACAALVGLALLGYGATAMAFGGRGFGAAPSDGADVWLGIEGNGWTNALFLAAGTLLLVAARTTVLIVAVALAAASIIALADGEEPFGILAANAPTGVAWGVAAAMLLASLARRRAPATGTPPSERPGHDDVGYRGTRTIRFGLEDMNVDEPAGLQRADVTGASPGVARVATEENLR